jgi:hypothetical protein
MELVRLLVCAYKNLLILVSFETTSNKFLFSKLASDLVNKTPCKAFLTGFK